MQRWQIKTTNTETGDELCTTEMPNLAAFGLPGLGYRYESCIFLASGDSEVLDRYDSQEAAEAAHEVLAARHLGAKLITNEGEVP